MSELSSVRSVRKVFGLHLVPVRFAPLVTVAIAVLLLAPTNPYLVPADLVIAPLSALLSMGGGRWPLPTVLGQSALLAVAAFTTTIGHDVVQSLAAFALLELLMRRGPGWQRRVGTLAVVAATAVNMARDKHNDIPLTIFWTVLIVCVAAGLGVYMFSLRLWMVRYHEKFQEAERLRESEHLAVRTIERAAIARELHDLIAHHVASIVLRVGVARHVELSTADAAAVLDDVHDTGTEALAQLRELVGVLRDPAAMHADPHLPLLEPADLRSALETVAERVRKAGLPVETDIDDTTSLDAVHRLAVLRIAQEGLTNALRHATGATLACLVVRVSAGSVLVEVRDNGSGPAGGAGHGLIGLAERVQLIGGDFRAGPDGDGWCVRARMANA